MRSQGFTLIELVTVIVLLGILSVIAAPKFINLQTDARNATLKSVSGSIKSAVKMARMQFLMSGADLNKSLNRNSPGFPQALKPFCRSGCNYMYGYPQNGVTILGLMNDLDTGDEITYAGTKFTGGDNKYLFAFKDNINNPGSQKPSIKELTCYVYYQAPERLGAPADIGIESCN